MFIRVFSSFDILISFARKSLTEMANDRGEYREGRVSPRVSAHEDQRKQVRIERLVVIIENG